MEQAESNRTFLVLYENGYDNISVYDGGWYEWLMHDDYPVQVGDPQVMSVFTQQLENFLQEKQQNKTKAESVENFCENIIQRLGALSLDISDSVW